LQKEFNDNVGQVFCVQKSWAHPVVVGSGVMLGVIISKIGQPWPPVDKELALTGPVFDPIKSYVNGLGSFLFDGVIRKTLSRVKRILRLGVL